MGRLLKILEGFNLGYSGTEDERIWLLDIEKGFSVKSSYFALSHTKGYSILLCAI